MSPAQPERAEGAGGPKEAFAVAEAVVEIAERPEFAADVSDLPREGRNSRLPVGRPAALVAGRLPCRVNDLSVFSGAG
ncbi:hypothetical protein D5S18_25855 [Nocardia panacis]|uniref:Uncharacterized protein n=1 Tax=Nocardia panacis TaxID=2340916 RepID=A0A3A4K2I4_9NOCA|nr:hypothetical protein D5S18_25855 [Nocardia panacis]